MITNNNILDFSVGERVQLHPTLDRWMMGDRYGEIVKITNKSIHVHLDKSGQTLRFLPMHLQVNA